MTAEVTTAAELEAVTRPGVILRGQVDAEGATAYACFDDAGFWTPAVPVGPRWYATGDDDPVCVQAVLHDAPLTVVYDPDAAAATTECGATNVVEPSKCHGYSGTYVCCLRAGHDWWAAHTAMDGFSWRVAEEQPADEGTIDD
jgi:hypothetical protein